MVIMRLIGQVYSGYSLTFAPTHRRSRDENVQHYKRDRAGKTHQIHYFAVALEDAQHRENRNHVVDEPPCENDRTTGVVMKTAVIDELGLLSIGNHITNVLHRRIYGIPNLPMWYLGGNAARSTPYGFALRTQ